MSRMPVTAQRIADDFGIEVTDKLIWQGWEPGREYTKKIILKNVNQKTKKLKYQIPNTKFFITKYPQPIVLSSGKSVSLPVTFRPLEKSIYEDSITFHTQGGQFQVPMRAMLPQSKLILPDAVHFGMAAVKDQVEEDFEMINASNVKTMFSFSEVASPFALIPLNGTVLPKSKAVIKATFKPEAAFVYQFDAVCRFTPESSETSTKVVTLEGIGKFPHLCLLNGKQSGNNIKVDFGRCPVGKEKHQLVEIKNCTPVSAPFQVLQTSHTATVDHVFSCSQYHGVVPRSGTVVLKIGFKSSVPDMSFADEFKIRAVGTPGASILKCIGHSIAPSVAIKTSHVNFGVTTTGDSVTRSFQLMNNQNSSAYFQFPTSNSYSAFQLDVSSGEVKPNSSQTIVVTFVPRKPINYYKKLVCLVHNQAPLYIKLFGTCHSDECKPDVLHKYHLERYELNAKRGLTRLAPEELHQLKLAGKIVVNDDGSLSAVDELLQKDLHLEMHELTAWEEFFNDGTATERSMVVPHASADVRHLDFGRCTFGPSYQKTVTVTNHTKGKVTCLWMSGMNTAVFTISPEEQDILPLRSASFRVTFQPAATEQFFGAELEAYVYFKSMRDHKLVKENTFCPPWCISVGVFGHTFPLRSEAFVPNCTWDSSNLIFPPTSPSLASYKTMLLNNTGRNPLHFDFDVKTSSAFSCKPAIGLCQDKYQVIVFRMLPSPPGIIKETMERRVNVADKYTDSITLLGTSEGPAIDLKPKDVLYFKPTCVGTYSTREVTVKNNSRVPLRFHWKILKKDIPHLKVDLEESTILPYETQNHTWSFVPNSEKRYIFKVTLSAIHEDAGNEATSSQTLRITGEGLTGTISTQSKLVDFGNVVVGTSSKKELTLRNDSDCSLHYRLFLEQSIRGPYADESTSTDPVVIELDHCDFLLPARAKRKVQLTVYPGRRLEYVCKLYYDLLATVDTGGNNVVKERQYLCDITASGVYPSLFVSDVRASGCLLPLSKSRLWELFSLERFNTYLDGDPAKEELRYTVATRHSTRRRMPVHTRAVLDFNFNSSPYLSNLSTVYISLQNKGSSDSEWMFLFPTDLQLEMEYWAQTGQFDQDELHEMFIMDNQLFSIEPRKGILKPGQSSVVILTYSHMSIGVHKLPVLFKISRGREVLLNFVGTTVDPSDTYLHFSSFSHTFTPLPIGDVTPPVQRYKLYNGGGQTVQFELDLTGLDKIQQENFDWRVLECLTPKGEINPGESFDVLWIFSPLEPKMYIVDVPVYFVGGETTMITFTGVGYDPVLMGHTMTFMDSSTNLLPEKQSISVPEQLLYLSVERLDFGNFPLFARSRRTIYLENRSSVYTVSFNWILPCGESDQIIQIEPEHGYVEPGETCLCKVILYSEGPACVYDLDIICEVVNESHMAKYNQELIKWYARQEEKSHLFTITEKTLQQDKILNQKKTKSSRKTEAANIPPDASLGRYDALPPISSNTETKPPVDYSQVSSDDPLPSPPSTFLLHLGVQGRSFDLEDFRKTFHGLSDYHFVKRASLDFPSPDYSFEKKAGSEELTIVDSILKMVLRDILIDQEFKDSLVKIHGEPIPYFSMIALDDANGEIAKHQEVPAGEEEVSNLAKDSGAPKPEGNQRQTPSIPGFFNDEMHQMLIRDCSSSKNLELSNDTQIYQRSEETRQMLESILENTIFNILREASCGEISLTARPRLISLPPSAKNKQKETISVK